MQKAMLVFVLGFCSALLGSAASALELEELYASPSPFGTPPSAPQWSSDSRRLAFLWANTDNPRRALWLVDQGGFPSRIPDAGADVAAPRAFAWHPDSRRVFSLRGPDLWVTDIADNISRRIETLGASARELRVAPDGSHLAYLRDGDLWVLPLDVPRRMAAERRLTYVGIPTLSTLPASQPQGRYSRPEREVGPGIWGGPTYTWSPDSQSIALHLVDRRAMRKVPFPDFLGPETRPNETRRGYPGDANESRRVGVLSVASGDLRLLDLQDPDAHQIIGFAWSPQGRLLVDVASDTAEDRWLYAVDETVPPREIWHSHRASRIYTRFAADWHPDGKRVIFLSDINDRYGLYLLDASGEDLSPRLLSDAAYDVLSAPIVLPKAQRVVYAANSPGPAERQVFMQSLASLEPGTESPAPVRITHKRGDNRAFPSPDGQRLAFLHSNDSAPPELFLKGTDAQDAQQLTQSLSPDLAARRWPNSRYVSFPSAIDGYRLHARILEPAVLEPGRRYPVLFGPAYSNTVRNRWSGIYSQVQQVLVDRGYLVVQLDMRGSTGYGRAFREEFLADFAGDDIEDIASAVSYLRSVPYADTERMGIWGSSYGGTLSVYTLLKKPGLFRAGVAAAAAVEPRFFGTDDVAIVRRPATHPDVFNNIASRYADNLRDHLLLIHGMQDQVVPFKTTAALADTLIRAGKDFDFAFAPGATHAWSRESHYSEYLFGKMLTHFDRYLQPTAP